MMRPFELFDSAKDLYSEVVYPVYKKHGLTFTEFNVLMFLANNPEYDTASKIVEMRRLTKSHVSISVRSLNEQGFISCEFSGGNHRTVHLTVNPSAAEIVSDGRAVQEEFQSILYSGFSDSEKEQLQMYFDRVEKNINGFYKGENNN